MSLLLLQDLTLSIDDKLILDKVNLQINKGDLFGLIGESGSGKSVTASAIIGLPPSNSSIKGKILLKNEDLLRKSESQMTKIRGNKISFVFQEPMTALNPLKTIQEQVAETLLIHNNISENAAYDIAISKLNKVGIDTTIISPSRYPHELSGGQRQRVVIAMAIALKPKLLIADEPTTALDVITQAQILNLLKHLAIQEKMTLLLITHDLSIIANVTNKVAVIREGKVIVSGETKHVFQNKRYDYTQALLKNSLLELKNPQKNYIIPLLEVKKVSKIYKKPFNLFKKTNHLKPAIQNISFDIFPGECLGVIGESGCGKSTLARTILGLEKLNSGSIFFEKEKISNRFGAANNIRSLIQVVFQDPYGSFNPRHRIQRILLEPLNLIKRKKSREHLKEKLIRTLHSVEMKASDLNKFPHEFSGGQRQRIAIARALISKPKLIILDESLSALDTLLKKTIINLLKKLSNEYNLSYLFISHDLNLIKSITDRVLIMKDGTIIESGLTKEVLQAPKNPYTQSLISSTPVIPQTWLKENNIK